MWEFIFLLFVILFFLPLALSITAIAKVQLLKKQVDHILSRTALRKPSPVPELPKQPEITLISQPPPPPSPPPRQESPVPGTRIAERLEKPVLGTKVPVPASNAPAGNKAKSSNRATESELWLGGKATSYVGIGLLLIGVAFMVGYAISHGWLGPAARVTLGMLGGLALIATGEVLFRKEEVKLHAFSSLLAGGGAAIIYFCAYAAYVFYALIPAMVTALALASSAGATLALAVRHRSQAVAVTAVVGAFVMPLLLDTPAPRYLALMTYAAVVNVPVLWLGLYRNWQGTYNSAFAFTWLLFGLVVLEAESVLSMPLLGFAVLFFSQFAAMGLWKLRNEPQKTGRPLDLLRLILNATGLLMTVPYLLQQAGHSNWTAAALALIGLIHLALMQINRRWLPAFKDETLAWLIGSITFFTFALPAQFSGVWLSLGFALEGLVLAILAARYRIPLLQSAALAIGSIGLGRALFIDPDTYATPPTLFWNARFGVGLLSSLLLGAQGWLASRNPVESKNTTTTWLIGATPFLIWLFIAADAFWTLGSESIWAWLVTSIALAALTLFAASLATWQKEMGVCAMVLLVLLPLKLFVDLLAIHYELSLTARSFMNEPFIVLALLFAFTLWLTRRITTAIPIKAWERTDFPAFVHVASLLGFIWLVTEEWSRWSHAWSQTAITLWWATAAIALVISGMIRPNRPRRLTGLFLFAVTTGKLLLVDLTLRSGLERALAFIGAGILLLAVAYLYQKGSQRWLNREG